MGTLNVYIKSGNTKTKYWSQSGDQGNEWKFVTFDILSLGPFKIIFEGIRGDDYTSDIALDDIVLLHSSCSGKSAALNIYSITFLHCIIHNSLNKTSKLFLTFALLHIPL